MTSAIKTIETTDSSSSPMRPISLPDDLRAVADLVEMCFAATLDDDGRRFIRQMRKAAASRKGLNTFSSLPGSITGFVWVEQGEIVGNLNLIPVLVRRHRAYLMANVAVHPDFRRRGIAHSLTEAGIELAASKRVRNIWLQVDEDNLTAQHLYQGFSFGERARRTVWHSQESTPAIKVPPSVRIKSAQRTDWQQQKAWLKMLYNHNVRWNLPINFKLYAPGISGSLLRLLNERKVKQWSAYHHTKWIGSLTWQSSYSQADWFWLSAPPEKRELAILALIPYARKVLQENKLLRPQRKVAVNFPAGEATEAFKAVGLTPHNTLIWMEKILS